MLWHKCELLRTNRIFKFMPGNLQKCYNLERQSDTHTFLKTNHGKKDSSRCQHPRHL